jgi:hypothetical protein
MGGTRLTESNSHFSPAFATQLGQGTAWISSIRQIVARFSYFPDPIQFVS